MGINMERVNVHKGLNVQLTNGELAQRAHDCAVLIDDLAKSESSFKEIKKEWTGKHKEMKAKIANLAVQHTTGKEYRDVSCVACFDLAKRWTWYEYNGDRYEERAMTEYEVAQVRQRALFNDGVNVAGITDDGKPKKSKLKAVDNESDDDSDESTETDDDFEETITGIL